jgi:NADH-quinone oxidoreductase subunit L
LIGCIAIAGIPPFSGFFSKDEILIGAYAQNPVFYWVGLGGALMTAFYMFRLYAMTFRGSFRGTQEQEHHLHESPWQMTLPLIVLAFLAAVAGFIGIPELFAPDAHRLERYLEPVFTKSYEIVKNLNEGHHVSHATEYILLAVSIISILIAIVFAWSRYSKKPETEDATGFGKILANKWYVDELYDTIISKPLLQTAEFFNRVIEKAGIDGFVNGVGKSVHWGSRQLRLMQNGQVGAYVLWMVLGILLLFVTTIFF